MYAELKRKICKVCKTEKNESDFPEHKRKNKIYRRPFCFDCKKKTYFESDLWKHYKLRPQDYKKLYEEQSGTCACCGVDESFFKRTLHVDHDHETKQIRGLLCTQCNPGIGYFKHSIDRLELAIAYLKKFKK